MTIVKAFKSIKYAFKGFKVIWKEEHNFRIELLSALLVIICLIVFHASYFEAALCVIAIIIVLSAEIVNTAVEDLCNKIEKSQDPVIGRIKDAMAAYVFVSVIGAFVIGVIVFVHHFLF